MSPDDLPARPSRKCPVSRAQQPRLIRRGSCRAPVPVSHAAAHARSGAHAESTHQDDSEQPEVLRALTLRRLQHPAAPTGSNSRSLCSAPPSALLPESCSAFRTAGGTPRSVATDSVSTLSSFTGSETSRRIADLRPEYSAADIATRKRPMVARRYVRLMLQRNVITVSAVGRQASCSSRSARNGLRASPKATPQPVLRDCRRSPPSPAVPAARRTRAEVARTKRSTRSVRGRQPPLRSEHEAIRAARHTIPRQALILMNIDSKRRPQPATRLERAPCMSRYRDSRPTRPRAHRRLLTLAKDEPLR